MVGDATMNPLVLEMTHEQIEEAKNEQGIGNLTRPRTRNC
jgi:hypothetical protein